jgi:hypothetical protein
MKREWKREMKREWKREMKRVERVEMRKEWNIPFSYCSITCFHK